MNILTVTKIAAVFMAMGMNISNAMADAPQAFVNYQVDGLIKNTLTCKQEAEALGQRFKLATGAAIYKTECAADTFDGYSVVVTYVANKEFIPTSAIYGLFWDQSTVRSVSNDDPLKKPMWGVYKTREACIQDSASRIADFELQTALKAVSVSCSRADLGQYALRIDAFGVPAKRFFFTSSEFYGDVDQVFADNISKLIASKGSEIRYSGPWGSYALTLYYAQNQIEVDSIRIGNTAQLDNTNQCAAELAQASRAITEITGVAPAVSRCLGDHRDGTSYINFAFPNIFQRRLLQLQGPEYGEYGACALDRKRALDKGRELLKVDIRGAICVRESSVSPSKFILMYLVK